MDEYDSYSDNDVHNGGFHEDDLSDDEYDLLYDVLPTFKKLALDKQYSVSDDLLKEYLWEAHYDIDEALLILSENHKRTYND